MASFPNPNLLGKPLCPHFGIVSVSWSWNIAAYTTPGMCSQISQSPPIPLDYLWPTALTCTLLDTYQHLRRLPASSIVQPLANIWSSSYQETGVNLFIALVLPFKEPQTGPFPRHQQSPQVTSSEVHHIRVRVGSRWQQINSHATTGTTAYFY